MHPRRLATVTGWSSHARAVTLPPVAAAADDLVALATGMRAA